MDQHWQALYERAIPPASARLRALPGVILGFHSVIDGIKHINGPDIEGLFNCNVHLVRDTLAKLDTVPAEIRSPSDLFAGLLHSIMTGKTYRMNIRDEWTFRWMLEHVPYDRLRLGGTSGCMANALAPLGMQRLLVYTNPPSRQLLELFGPNENLMVVAESGDLVHPHDAAQSKGIDALHWGLEFTKGTTICIGGETFTAPQDNRMYACWNPVNEQLQISEIFLGTLRAHAGDFSHMIISGFQLLSPVYEDGSFCTDHIWRVVKSFSQVHGKNPALRLHVEFDTIPSGQIREDIVTRVLPYVDSFGLNEVELEYLARDLEFAVRTPAGGIQYYLDALVLVMNRTGLQRIHFHTLGYYLCLLRIHENAAIARDALLLAAVVAADRAQTGDVRGDPTMERVAGLPVSAEGLDRMKELAALVEHPEEFLQTGIAAYRGFTLLCIPTIVVEHPALTVGLGDTISAVAFLAEG